MGTLRDGKQKAPPVETGGASMVRAEKRLVHSTGTGRASSPAGGGKEEPVVELVSHK
jgi:hypothetical protein